MTLNTATGVISGTPTLALVNAASFSAAVTDSGGFVSASQSFSIAVAAAPGPATVATTTSLSAAPTTATLGSPFTLTATVSPAAASGKVTFYDGSAILGYAALSGGTATIITRQLPAGARSLRVRYPGDATYLPSASSPLPGTTVNTAVANVLTSRADYPSGVIISASAVAGDFNGDQKTDLVIGSQSQNLGVLLGNGDGTFRSGGQYALSANSWVSAGDFNGDGKLDLVILRSGTIVVAQGNGDGTFQSPVSIGTGGGSIAVADFNNDGKADLASAGSIFLGLGDATFLGPFALAATGPVTAGDFNGDGTADLAVNNGNLVILLGNGDGTFQNVATYSTAVAAQTPFTAVDFNGDGRLDLVGVANNQVSVASGNGNGTFQPAKLFAAGESPAGLTTSDFNGDGFPDIATFNIAGATAGMNLLLGNGDGTFQAVKPYSGFINPGALVAGEFNGDGRADIALVTTGGPVTVLLGAFSLPSITSTSLPPGETGYSWSKTLTASGGTGPYSNWVVSTGSLPPGLSLNAATGLISGTPTTVAGTPFSFSITVTDSLAAVSLPQAFSITVAPRVAATSAILPGAIVGISYTSTLQATTGFPPYSNWTLTSGSLPPGLTLNASTGVISGVPSATLAASFAFDLTVQDSQGFVSLPGSFSIPVSGINVSPAPLPAGQVGALYSTTVAASGGTPPYSNWQVATGSLPPGLTLNSATGVINGTPLTDAGSPFTFTLIVQDATSAVSAPRPLSIAVVSPPGSPALLANPVSFSFDATQGGTPPAAIIATLSNQVGPTVTWSITSSQPWLVASPSSGPTNSSTQISVAVNQAGLQAGTFRGTLSVTAPGYKSVFINVTLNVYARHTGLKVPPTTIGSNFPSAQHVAFGDFNLDGFQDLVVSSNGVQVYRNDGAGGFVSPFAVPTLASVGAPVAVGDFNNDGKPDIAVLSRGITILLGDGASAFTARSTVPLAGTSFVAGDFNLDGWLDFASAGGNTVNILLANGSGGYASPVAVTVGSGATSIALLDLNGDGIPDLATANSTANSVTLLTGNGLGGFVTSSGLTTGATPLVIVSADFNGDGRPDLATYNQGSGDVSAWLGNGTGGFVAMPRVTIPYYPLAYDMIAAEINGDGKPDLVVSSVARCGSSCQGLSVGFLPGDGAGGFTPGVSTMYNPAGIVDIVLTSGLAAADVNGDGTTDIVITGSGNIPGGTAGAVGRVYLYTGISANLSPQSLTFAPVNTHSAGDAPFPVSAVASSGLPVTVISNSPSVCNVGAFQVTLVAAGTCSLTATQGGDVFYAAATPATISFTVLAVSQTISFATLSDVGVGTAPFTLSASATSGLPVTFASNTPAVCLVSGNVLTAVGAGICSVTASQPGTGVYQTATPVTRTFTVSGVPLCSYALSPDSGSITIAGGAGSFRIVTGNACSWTAVSNAAWIVLKSASGGPGSAVLTYSVASNDTNSARTGTITANGQIYTLTQFGSACSFALSRMTLDIPPGGGSALLSVFTSGPSCTYNSTVSDPVNVVVAPATAPAPAQVTVTVSANPGSSARSFTANIGDQTVTINQPGSDCAVSLNSNSAAFSAAGGNGSVTITTPNGCTWSAAAGPPWVSVTSGAVGSGPGGTLSFSVEPNPTTSPRSGQLTIGGQGFVFTQAGLFCDFSLDASALATPLSATGGSASIGITTRGSGCAWTASSDAAWLTVVAPPAGTGNGSASLTAAVNPSATPRSGHVTIAGYPVDVRQAGTTCSYSLRSAGGTVPAAGTSGVVSVITGGGCVWSAASNSNWLTIASSGATGSADIQFTAAPNHAAAPRTGTLTLGGQLYTVTQAAAVCSFTLNLAGANVGAAGLNGGSFTVATTTPGCAASAVSFSNWLTTSTSFSGQSGLVTYSVAANSSASARTGVIKLANQSFTVNQAGASCSFTLSTSGAVFGQLGGTGSIVAIASGSGCSPALGATGFVTAGSLSGPVAGAFTQTFSVPPFVSVSNAVRTVRLTFGGKTFLVKQVSW